jgi:DNA repair protein RadA/Sms
VPAPSHIVFFGEIGLSGEIRPVSQPDLRMKEAQKLGFTEAVLAKSSGQKLSSPSTDFTINSISHIDELVEFLKSR